MWVALKKIDNLINIHQFYNYNLDKYLVIDCSKVISPTELMRMIFTSKYKDVRLPSENYGNCYRDSNELFDQLIL